MSYFDDASLVMIPSGYKDQKVYSVKPIDGSGDLTFSRASNATRVNSSGLVERVRTNEALYSEDQTNWTDQSETSVTANTAANPLNGAVTADKVIPSVIPTDHYRGLSMATLIGEFSVSIYVKADGYDFFDFGVYNSTALAYAARATFDLSTATYSLTSGTSASITSVGSGWYHVSMLASVASSSALSIYHRVRPTGGTGVYSGDGTSGMLLWGCQLESGVLTPYIGPTTTTAVSVGPVSGLPRLDYSGGASCPSLLLEPQTTAITTYSEQIDNAAWGKQNVSVTANNTASPSGYVDADKIVEDTANSTHFVSNNFTASTATSHTFSVFAKMGERKYLCFAGSNVGAFSATYDLEAGTVIGVTGATASIENYGNGWYRCVAVKAIASAGGVAVRIGTGSTATVASLGLTQSYLGDGTSGLFIWGVNVTATSYVQSYIPTLSSAVTRVADAASKTGISSLIGQTEGVLYIELEGVNYSPTGGAQLCSIDDGTSSKRMELFANTSNLIGVYVQDVSAQVNFTSAVPATGRIKIALAYKLNDYALYINGTLAHTDTSGTVPTVSALRLFGRYDGLANGSQGVKQALLFKTRLSNADLATLTTL